MQHQQDAHGSQAPTEYFPGKITLPHKANLKTFEKTELIPSVFSMKNGMKLEINKQKRENLQIRGQ
jgi:hypothetical protein